MFKKLPTIVKIMFIALIYSLIMVSITSCDIIKESQKTKKDITKTTTSKTTQQNKGGVITSTILPENERPKDVNGKIIDTVIVFKENEITKTIYYKPDGTVQTKTECPDTYITQEEFTQFTNQSKFKENAKQEKFDSSIILYGFLGLGLLFIIALIFISWQFKGVIKSVNTTAQTIAGNE